MPQPNGLRTKEEHRDEIIKRWRANMATGMDETDALKKASADYHAFLREEGERKIAEVQRWLRHGRSH